MAKIKIFLKNNLITGCIISIPIVATVILLGWIIGLSDKLIAFLPAVLRPETYLGFRIPGLSVILTFIIIVVIGMIGRVYFGRFLLIASESIIKKIPFISGFYSAIKQLMDLLFISSEQKGNNKRQVVIVEFPRKGLHSVGFLTASVPSGKILNIFVPTTPNPTTGFFLMVPKEEVKFLSISMEDAFKLIISGGIVAPADKSTYLPSV